MDNVHQYPKHLKKPYPELGISSSQSGKTLENHG